MQVLAICYIPGNSFAPLSFISGYAYLILKKSCTRFYFGFVSFSTVYWLLHTSCFLQSLAKVYKDFFSFRSESRYLLLLTENYGALSILQQQIIAKQNEIRPVTIFGSSFPSDQEYTQVSRN